MNIDFDELAAIRIAMESYFLDEFEIIKQLKYELLYRGIYLEEIDNILVEFYKKFNIEYITIDIIKEIKINQIDISNIANTNTNQLEHNENNNTNLEENEIEENDIEDNNIEENDIEDNNIEDNNIEENDIEENDINEFQNTQNLGVNYNNFINMSNIFINYLQNNNINDIYDSSGFNLNLPNNTNYDISENISLNYNENQQTNNIVNQQPEQFLESLYGILNNTISTIQSNYDNMEDVKVTLDKQDIDNLSKKLLETNIDEPCSICLSSINKGEEIIELNCKHIFHYDCIIQYLRSYNYKCPICRKECGKAEYHI